MDAQRKLTATGRGDINVAGHCLSEICEKRDMAAPDIIAHSAWLRTTQTAKILAAAFPRATLIPEDSLLPGGQTKGVCEYLSSAEHTGGRHVLLVSHQPLVSHLVDYYLGFPHPAPALSPGGLVSVDMDVVQRDGGRLLFWALPPQYGVGI